MSVPAAIQGLTEELEVWLRCSTEDCEPLCSLCSNARLRAESLAMRIYNAGHEAGERSASVDSSGVSVKRLANEVGPGEPTL